MSVYTKSKEQFLEDLGISEDTAKDILLNIGVKIDIKTFPFNFKENMLSLAKNIIENNNFEVHYNIRNGSDTVLIVEDNMYLKDSLTRATSLLQCKTVFDLYIFYQYYNGKIKLTLGPLSGKEVI